MFRWRIRDRDVELGGRALVMGIVNVTPDSFSDGGQYTDPNRAVAHALELESQGADILDIGGESTRPGAEPVPADEELGRVLPVVTALAKQSRAILSIDTYKARVAQACLAAGAHVINDVRGLAEPDMVEAVRAAGAGAIVMHMQGTPQTMQLDPTYADVVADIKAMLAQRVNAIEAAGVSRQCLMIDPGIGFGKKRGHNLEILARLGEFRELELPLCLGVSRKSFLGKITGQKVDRRIAASLAAAAFALAQNGVDVLRVHEVQEHRDLVLTWQLLRETKESRPQ